MKFIGQIMAVFLLALTLTFIATPAKATSLGGVLEKHECLYDFSVDAGAVGSIDLCGNNPIPVGSVIESGYYIVETALASSGSATVAIGDAASGAKYLAATAFDNAAFTLATPKAIAIGVPNKVATANGGKPSITIATAALTGGKMRLILQVYKPTSRAL